MNSRESWERPMKTWHDQVFRILESGYAKKITKVYEWDDVWMWLKQGVCTKTFLAVHPISLLLQENGMTVVSFLLGLKPYHEDWSARNFISLSLTFKGNFQHNTYIFHCFSNAHPNKTVTNTFVAFFIHDINSIEIAHKLSGISVRISPLSIDSYLVS